MKQSELSVGLEVLGSTSRDWMLSTWSARRLRIVDTTDQYWTWDFTAKTYKASSAGFRAKKGIVVECLNKITGASEGQEIWSKAQLRGTWADSWKLVRGNAASRDKMQRDYEQDLAVKRQRQGVLMALARKVCGLPDKSYTVTDDFSDPSKMKVDVDLFEAMLKELDKQGWEYKLSSKTQER